MKRASRRALAGLRRRICCWPSLCSGKKGDPSGRGCMAPKAGQVQEHIELQLSDDSSHHPFTTILEDLVAFIGLEVQIKVGYNPTNASDALASRTFCQNSTRLRGSHHHMLRFFSAYGWWSKLCSHFGYTKY